MPQLPPLSLYIHVPWCVRKCPYCDFNSHQVRDELPEPQYVDCLLEDLDSELDRVTGRPLQSIFIGGGTPSLFGAQSYARLLGEIARRIPFCDGIEITLEANPGTFEYQKFADYRAAGINRVSLGIQSFDDQSLKSLGRIHNGGEAIAAAGHARQIFDRVNLDLMHGLPGQTPQMARADLEQAIALQPDQISWYQLTLEPNTEFYARPPQLPVEESLWEIQEAGQALLEANGYRQYEISAFARPGGEGRHNLNYWQFGDYVGIGAGAHGKLSYFDGDEIQIERRHKQRQPKGYMNAKTRLAGCERIQPEDLAFEFMLNALRLTDGVAVELFSERTGLPLTAIQPRLDQAVSRGLLSCSDGKMRPTAEGRLFLNDLLTLFLD